MFPFLICCNNTARYGKGELIGPRRYVGVEAGKVRGIRCIRGTGVLCIGNGAEVFWGGFLLRPSEEAVVACHGKYCKAKRGQKSECSMIDSGYVKKR